MKKITLFFLIIILSPQILFSQHTIIAHRGASYLAPENTLASVKLAWELNADAVEIDVYLSKDNQIVVIHDEDTKRVSLSKKEYKVAETEAAQLRKLDVGSWKSSKYKGEKIPLLAEVLETIPEGKILVIEIKCGSEIIPALKSCVLESGKINQLVFISFGWQTIIDVKKEFPKNNCYWLSSNPIKVATQLDKVLENNLNGVNLYHKIITKSVVRKYNKLGLEVLAWTVDNSQKAKDLKEMGVTAITTNRPKWMKEQLQKQ